MRLVDPKKPTRRAAAAVELALLLPLLTTIVVIACDFSRLYYSYLTISNCARNGALWASDPTMKSYSPYSTVTAAAQAGASNLSSLPTVASSSGTDGNGHSTVSVTVSYTFHMLSSYLGFSTVSLSRTVEMRVSPATPN